MPRKRPTESSWDSDEDLLKEDSISLNAFEKEMEEVDEDALLGGSDDEYQPEAHAEASGNTSLVVPNAEFEDLDEGEQIELEVEEPYDLDVSGDFSHIGKKYIPENEGYSGDQARISDVGQNSTFESYKNEQVIARTNAELLLEKNTDHSIVYQDSESENEDEEDSRHRDRFRTERSNVVRIASSQPKTEIPDTLEISKEDQEKIEEFMHKPQQKNRKNQGAKRTQGNRGFRFSGPSILGQPNRPPGMFCQGGIVRNRFQGVGPNRVTSLMSIDRPFGQMFGAGDGYLGRVPEEIPRHKILINPHFRGRPRPQQELRLPWEHHQRAAYSASSGNSFPQQSALHNMVQSVPQPSMQQQPSQFRPLMSIDLTQRPPQFQPQPIEMQRHSLTAQRHLMSPGQTFSSAPQHPVQLQFPQGGVRLNFQPPRVPEAGMFQTRSVLQQPQSIQRPLQFIQGQQPSSHGSQHQALNFSASQQPQPSFPPSHVQPPVIQTLPQPPGASVTNFAGQPQSTFMNQPFSGSSLQPGNFRMAAPHPPPVLQPLVGPFIPQPQVAVLQNQSQVIHNQSGPLVTMHQQQSSNLPSFGETNSVPQLMQGVFSGSDHRFPAPEEIGQPIETVVHRQVQGRSNSTSNPLPLATPKLNSLRFSAGKLGYKKFRTVGQTRNIASNQVVSQTSSITSEASTAADQDALTSELRQKQKLEERARRFAQTTPVTAAIGKAKTAIIAAGQAKEFASSANELSKEPTISAAGLAKAPVKRLSDTSVEGFLPAAKVAKVLASKKALHRAAAVQKRRELMVQQQKQLLEKDTQPEQRIAEDPQIVASQNSAYDADLQRGIEEQKALREKILKMKEQRRLHQAAERRKDLDQRNVNTEGLTEGQLETNPGLVTSVSYGIPLTSDEGRSATVNPHVQKQNLMTKKPLKKLVVTKAQYKAMMEQMQNLGSPITSPIIQSLTRQQKEVSPNLLQKAIAPPQLAVRPSTGPVRRAASAECLRFQNPSVGLRLRTAPPPTRMPSQPAASRLGAAATSFSKGQTAGPPQPRRFVQLPSEQISSQKPAVNLARRVVIGAGDRSLMSSLVAIEGLAMSTSAAAIRQLAEKSGPIQQIQLMSTERKALVKFHNAEHAALFAKKFNRHMLDLSMIVVQVIPA